MKKVTKSRVGKGNRRGIVYRRYVVKEGCGRETVWTVDYVGL